MKINETALQIFLNQLIWSPDLLESLTLSHTSVQQLRQFLIMVFYFYIDFD